MAMPKDHNIDKHFWGFADSLDRRHGFHSGLDTGGEVDSVHPEDDSTASDTLDPRRMRPGKLSDSGGEDYYVSELSLTRSSHVANGDVEPHYEVPIKMDEAATHQAEPKRTKSVPKKSKNARLRGLLPRGLPKKAPKQGAVAHRKRRPSGRVLRTPQHLPSVSEGDMAQADEMGEGGGDDGFVETSEDQPKKKNKKKGASVSVDWHSSDADNARQQKSSPLNKLRRLLVTRSFHQAALRDQRRPKPRSRRPKSNVFTGTDVSAQETTTPVPYSSDTHEEVESSAGGESPECTNSNGHHPLYVNLDSEGLEAVESPEHLTNNKAPHGNGTVETIGQYAVLNPISMDEVEPSLRSTIQADCSAVNSDRDCQSKATGKRKKKQWEPTSDMSTTGPVSSETSDLDTSANEQTSGGKGKKRFGNLFSGLSFGRSRDKGKDKEKEKTKDKVKSKDKDKSKEKLKSDKKPKSKLFTSSASNLSRTGSEPQLNEADEEVILPSRGAFTPDPVKINRVVTHRTELEPDVWEQTDSKVPVTSIEDTSKEASHASSGTRSNQSSTKSPPNKKGFQSIQERISHLQRNAGIAAESDSDSLADRTNVHSRRTSNSDNTSGAELTCPSPTNRPKSSRIMQAMEIFERNSTNSTGEATPRKSSQAAVECRTDHSSRKSSTSSVSSGSTCQLVSQTEAVQQKTLSVVEEYPPEQLPEVEISVVEGSGSEDIQPPAIPSKRSKSPNPSGSVLEDMKLFAKLQASTSKSKLGQPPTLPPPYKQSKKASRSAQSSPKMSENRKSLSKTDGDCSDRTSPAQHVDAPNSDLSPQNSPVLNGLTRSESFSNTLAQSEPDLLDSPSSPPLVPVRQQSKHGKVKSRTLPRRTPTHCLHRAASVDSCLDDSHKSVSPPAREIREPSSDSSQLPTLGDDLGSFLDKAFGETTGLYTSPSPEPNAEKKEEIPPAMSPEDTPEVDKEVNHVSEDEGLYESTITQTFSRSRVTKSARHTKRHSVGNIVEEYVPEERRKVHRTPSMDALNDRTERLSRHFFASSSSEDEDEDSDLKTVRPVGFQSPSTNGKSAVPLTNSLLAIDPPQRGPIFHDWEEGEEPLYQYVRYAQLQSSANPVKSSGQPSNSSMNRMSVYETLGRRDSMGGSVIPGLGSLRFKLWKELPEVEESGVLKDMTDDQIRIQETFFEIYTSEGSYGRSMDVLLEEYSEDPCINPYSSKSKSWDCLISKRDFQVLFSNVRECREVSRSFWEALDERRKENVVCGNIFDIMSDYASSHFNCYVRYISNQRYQEQTLKRLLTENTAFKEFCTTREKSKSCQGLGLISFLLLPMQRITRMPLLILAVLNRMALDDPERSLVEKTLKSVQELVAECNEGAKQLERTEQLVAIHKQINFGKLKPIPIVSSSRYLVKRGHVTELKLQDRLFGRTSIMRRPIQLFSFSDFIIIGKKKKAYSVSRLGNRDTVFSVLDHGVKTLVHCEHIPCHPNVTYPKSFEDALDGDHMLALWVVSQAKAKFAFLVSILENAEKERASYLLVAQNETEMVRWIDALNPPLPKDPDQQGTTYEIWDLPQFQTLYDYAPQQPDELALLVGDVIRVFKKMADGWYYGENMRNLECGWFPSNYTFEMDSEHKRRRVIREGYKRLSQSNFKTIGVKPESAVAMGVGLGEVTC